MKDCLLCLHQLLLLFYPSVHQQEVPSPNWPGPGQGFSLLKGSFSWHRCLFGGHTLGLCQAPGDNFDCSGCCINKAELTWTEINTSDMAAGLSQTCAFICEKTDPFACSRWQHTLTVRSASRSLISTHTHNHICGMQYLWRHPADLYQLTLFIFSKHVERLWQHNVNYNIPGIKS